MGVSLRLLLLAAFTWLGFVLYHEAQIQAHLPEPDNSKVVMRFAGAILNGTGVAVILTLLVVPALGDQIGSFFFNPSETVEHDLHSDAIAKLAQGDPEGAIEVYQQILGKEPGDAFPYGEIARICCRSLGDTPRAAAALEQALDAEWPQEQGSFLANRLVDVYLLQDDMARARQILVEVASSMEGTKYAANAMHRMHEIDRVLETNSSALDLVQDGGMKRAVIEHHGLASNLADEENSTEEAPIEE